MCAKGGTKTELLRKYIKVSPKFEVCTTEKKMWGGVINPGLKTKAVDSIQENILNIYASCMLN
jgi:hypothetical protein